MDRLHNIRIDMSKIHHIIMCIGYLGKMLRVYEFGKIIYCKNDFAQTCVMLQRPGRNTGATQDTPSVSVFAQPLSKTVASEWHTPFHFLHCTQIGSSASGEIVCTGPRSLYEKFPGTFRFDTINFP